MRRVDQRAKNRGNPAYAGVATGTTFFPLFFLISLLILVATPGQAAEVDSVAVIDSVATYTPGQFEGTVAVDSTGTGYLPHRYIDFATFTIQRVRGDSLIHLQDWKLFATPGILLLNQGPDTVRISFRYLPVSLPDTVQVEQPIPPAVLDSLLAGQEVVSLPERSPFDETRGGFASSLRRSGHITRGVQVGTGRDVSLESGLRLSLEGRLARDVEVRALLDDRNLPIQPEGTSRRLDEIDQIYVEIQSGRAEGRFGDYRLETDAGRFGTTDRRLEGGRVSWNGPDVQGTAAGAVTRAVFHTNRFTGVDGVQGPYQLTGRDGERDFLVVGGSEKVWIDGQEMQRGASGDYTIDYARGEITFTPRVPITSESRIEVDFEYSPEAFPRNLYAGELRWTHPDQWLRASAVVMQEGDDPERPFGFDMTDDIRDQLRDAGDVDGRVLVPTAEEVEQGDGDYIRVDTTWTDDNTYTVFAFVEPGPDGDPRGNWLVPFTDVGAGEGDYTREYDPLLGLYRHDWVGPGQGNYVARRSLPLPERRRHAALSLVAGEYSDVTLQADLGVSDVDQNTLSGIGDGNNVGFAQQVKLDVAPFGRGEITPTSTPLRLTGQFRNEPGRYRPFGRTRAVEFERRWGLDSARTVEDEREGEVRLEARPIRQLRLDTGGGWLERGGDLNNRYDAGGEYVSRFLDARLFGEQIRSENDSTGFSSDWTRARGDITGRILGLFAPGVDGEWEHRDAYSAQTDAYSGHRYWRARESFGLIQWKGHSGNIYLQQRRRDRQFSENDYDPLYREAGYGARWDWRPPTTSWRSRLEFNHSDKNFQVADSADVTTDLAAISAGYAPFSSALMTDLNYQLSRTVTRPTALIAYEVPAGQGDYIRVNGEYVYDPEIGDIILRPEPTGDAVPTSDLAAAFNLDWSPHRLPEGKGRQDGFGWEDISLVTQLEAREVTTWDNSADIYLLDLSAFQTDSTVEGRLSLRQDVYLWRTSARGNLRLQYLAEKRLNNLYLTGSERYKRDVLSARGRNNLGEQIDLETEAEYERLAKTVARRGGTDWYRMIRARSRVGWSASTIWRFTFEVGGLLDRDIVAGEDVQGLSLTPGFVWAVRERGRISGEFEALWIDTQLNRVPFELANGRPAGRNGRANLRAEYQLGNNLTARAIYTGRFDEGRDPIHVARMEVSAFF